MLLLPTLALAQFVVNEGAIAYTKVAGSPGSPPARLAAPLPGTLADWAAWGEDVAPIGIVRAELCLGDPSRWDAFVDAADRAIASGDPREEVVRTYSGMLVCEPTVCAPARAAWAAGGTRAALAIRALVACPDVEDIFASSNVPEEPWLDYWRHRQPPKRVARRAAATVATALTAGDARRVARLVSIAGERDDPEVARSLVAAVGVARNEADRRVVLQGLAEQSSPEARRLFDTFCAADGDARGCRDGPGGGPAGMPARVVPVPLVPPRPTEPLPPVVLDWLPGRPTDVAVHATRLAWVGGLRGVRFDHSGSALTAWMDGLTYTIVVYHVGPDGDLRRVLGLLNTLARTRGEAVRWLEVRGGVAIAPGPVLEQYVAQTAAPR